MNNYRNADFLLSVATTDQLPPDEGIEVAFIGRSNAGKSSIINELTGNKKLARTSKTPGRTQFINLFTIDANRRFADMPGYGFARVPEAVRELWLDNMEIYFNSRKCLKGLILVMDMRHPLQAFDQNILDSSTIRELPVHIILNKLDKLGSNEARKTEVMTRKAIEKYGELVSLQTFSVLKKQGLEQLRKLLDSWYGF